jgi:hypothetical protein
MTFAPRTEAAMTELLTLPPPPAAMAAMAAIPRSQIAPIVLGTQQGPAGHLGPEHAGAILMLQATFTDQDGFHRVLEDAGPAL